MYIVEVERDSPQFDMDIVNTVVDGIGDHFQRLKYANDELVVSVQNLLKFHKGEIEDSKSLLGRLTGMFSQPVDPDNLIIDGMRLFQCFEITGDRPMISLHVGKTYLVDRVSLESMINRVEKMVAKNDG